MKAISREELFRRVRSVYLSLLLCFFMVGAAVAAPYLGVEMPEGSGWGVGGMALLLLGNVWLYVRRVEEGVRRLER